MRISDWSSDVCSSDLRDPLGVVTPAVQAAVVDRLAHLEHAGGGHPGLVIARLIVTGGRRFNQPQPLPQPGGYRLAVVYQIGIADPPELIGRQAVGQGRHQTLITTQEGADGSQEHGRRSWWGKGGP